MLHTSFSVQIYFSNKHLGNSRPKFINIVKSNKIKGIVPVGSVVLIYYVQQRQGTSRLTTNTSSHAE